MSLLPASCRDAPETVGFAKTSQSKKMWKRLILLEFTTEYDFKFKTIHLSSENLPKFEIRIVFVNVLIDYNLMQNNSKVRTTVTSKWHLFVGLYSGKVKTCMQISTHVCGTGVSRSPPSDSSRALEPITHPTPVQRPGQVVPCPQREDGHRRRWVEA